MSKTKSSNVRKLTEDLPKARYEHGVHQTRHRHVDSQNAQRDVKGLTDRPGIKDKNQNSVMHYHAILNAFKT